MPLLRNHSFSLTRDLWCLSQPSYLSCSYVLRTPRGIWLFDAGMDSAGTAMLDTLAQMGAGPEDVRAIFLTHWHNDHAAGAAAIQALSGAPVYCDAREMPYLDRRTATTGWPQRLATACPEWGPWILIKGLLGNAIPRAIADLRVIGPQPPAFPELDVIPTPGHTPGHLAYYYRPGRLLFCGDALAVLGGKPAFMARAITPDLPAARRSILACLDCEIDWLCPGHREPLATFDQVALRRFRGWVASGGNWPPLGKVL